MHRGAVGQLNWNYATNFSQVAKVEKGENPTGFLKGQSPVICGDGRSRTAVQTTYQTAFYTLILPLVVGRGAAGRLATRGVSFES